MIRLIISPSPRTIELPDDYNLTYGQGTVIRDGQDAVLFAYGPVMLNEALVAADLLAKQGITLKVINMPWLNRIDTDWLKATAANFKVLFVLDNHMAFGGLGDCLLNAAMQTDDLRGKQIVKFAVDQHAACGNPKEVLRLHELDGESLARRIQRFDDC